MCHLFTSAIQHADSMPPRSAALPCLRWRTTKESCSWPLLVPDADNSPSLESACPTKPDRGEEDLCDSGLAGAAPVADLDPRTVVRRRF